MRCPWCGRKYQKSYLGYRRRRAFFHPCDKCKNYGMVNWNSIHLLIELVIAVLIFRIGYLYLSGYIQYLSTVAGCFLLVYSWDRLPYVRCHKGERWREDAMPETYLGRANIHWYPFWKNGVGLPFFRLADNRVFFACFVDESGKAVSHTVCIRIKKNLIYFWNNAKIFLLVQDLWKPDEKGIYPWDKANKIVIFNGRDIIGEGRIKRN